MGHDDFETRYRDAFARLGLPLGKRVGWSASKLDRAERRLAIKLPISLRTWFETVGRHEINTAHNRLLSPEALYAEDDQLVFMEENQAVVWWGIPYARIDEVDPPVTQGVNATPVAWYPQSPHASDFLIVALCSHFAACSEYAIHDYKPEHVAFVESRWAKLADADHAVGYASPGEVICVERDSKTIWISASTPERSLAIVRDLEQV